MYKEWPQAEPLIGRIVTDVFRIDGWPTIAFDNGTRLFLSSEGGAESVDGDLFTAERWQRVYGDGGR